MILLRKPEPYAIRQFLNRQLDAALNYSEVGATRLVPPNGYRVHNNRRQIGTGESDYWSACELMRRWQHMQLPWACSWPANTPLRAGENVAIVGSALGLWSLNACRIVYVENTESESARPVLRFGYALGTLQDHLLRGEERFVVVMHSDESVWAEILAFSKPNALSAKLGAPILRAAQRRFAQQSLSLMHHIVSTQAATRVA